MTFPETPLHVAMMIAVIYVGYFTIMYSISHKGKHTFRRCYLPLVLGFIVFCSGWYVMLGWHPEDLHCTHHCFPWGD